MLAPEEVREFRVTTDSMRRVGGKRASTRKRQAGDASLAKQEGGSVPSYSEMGAPVSTIGDVAAGMKDAASHGASAYAQTAQGVTPMTASGTLTSQIIPPIAMGQDPLGSPASVARAQAPMAGGSTVHLRTPKTRVLLRSMRKGPAGAVAGRKTEPIVGGAVKHLKTRKIGLAVKAMSKKLKKARKTAKKVASMSIETIKAALSKAGVLKGGSKAPPEMLRKMYKDLRTMKSGL